MVEVAKDDKSISETMELSFHDDFSIPDLFAPNVLPIERIDFDKSVEEGQNVDQWVEGGHNVNDEIVDEDINLDNIDEEGVEWDDERSYGRFDVEIPTQCSRPNLQETIYANPSGYISEDDEDDEIYGEEDCSDDDIPSAIESEFVQVEQGSFTVGMTFADAKEAREAINLYGVKFRYKLKFEKNDPTRLRVRCINDAECPFKLLVSKDGDNGGLAVKTAYMDHSCFIQREVPSMSQGFLANFFKNTIYKNPKFTVKNMQCEIKKHLKLHVSEHKCKRAKKQIIQELSGSFKQEFAILGAYAQMVKESNPGSKCEVQLREDGLENGHKIFKRIFVLMDACRMNWMQGCRPVISLDGCFLKGVTNGMLLTAVGKDANDQIVPIAWSVVNKETKNNWRWFLCWLRQELELEDGAGVTMISDMQKGLIDAVNNTLPKAEHRWCARHVYANWSKKWRGREMEKRFWKCAWSTFEEEFKANLEKLGEIKKEAAADVLKYPVHTWVRAFQSNRCCTYAVDNNISESFNACIMDARHKPIISMLEDIRVLAMTRIRDRRNRSASWIGEWSPAAMKIYEEAKEVAAGCRVLWNGASGYEIGEGEDKHTVKLDSMLCTCRVWELTGIPCAHAIAAMYYSKIEPLFKMSKWYHRSTYEKAYEVPILPVPGIKFFKTDAYAPIEPPPLEKQPGRPRKKRVRASNEPRPSSSTNRLSRKGQVQRCSICKGIGHKKNVCQASISQGKSQTSSSSRPQKMLPRRQLQKNTMCGVGVHVNINSGQTTINPGFASQRVIIEGDRYTPHDSDPIIRGPIPNERVIRRNLRHINFSGEGSEVRRPGALPFKPPGLQWNGSPCVTTNQLLQQRDTRKHHKGKYGESRETQGTSSTIIN